MDLNVDVMTLKRKEYGFDIKRGILGRKEYGFNTLYVYIMYMKRNRKEMDMILTLICT